LKDWPDLVALGTVCDMVPLTRVNRLFVRLGFAEMAKRKNPGLKALLEVAKVTNDPDIYHAGFIIGPRINAGGRIHKPDLGAQLLATEDPEEAKNIAWLLNDCNDKRREMQAEMERAAINKVEDLGLHQYPVVIVDDAEWHPGLAGLVAGRLKEKYGKPACVVTYANGEGKGSGRSVPGIHIAQAFIDARLAGLLDKGGGHAMAGGFTIKTEKLEEFRQFMQAHITAQGKAAQANVQNRLDGIITVQGVRTDFVRMIQNQVGPFGQDHPEPLFLLSGVRIHTVDVMKESHLRLLVSDWEGGTRIKAVVFRAVGTPLGDALLKQGRQPFHLCGHLKINEWQGRESVEFHIKDAAFAQAEVAEAV
jgi:single-stranded-DNA-specific exonuclease